MFYIESFHLLKGIQYIDFALSKYKFTKRVDKGLGCEKSTEMTNYLLVHYLLYPHIFFP